MNKRDDWIYCYAAENPNTYECPNCHSVYQLQGTPEENELNYCYKCGAHLITDYDAQNEEPTQRFELIRLLKRAYCELDDLKEYFNSGAAELCVLTRAIRAVLREAGELCE